MIIGGGKINKCSGFWRDDYISRSAQRGELSISLNLIFLCSLKWLSRDQFSNSFSQSQRAVCMWVCVRKDPTATVCVLLAQFLYNLASGFDSCPSATHSNTHPTSIPPTQIKAHTHSLTDMTSKCPESAYALSSRERKGVLIKCFLGTFEKE